MRRILYFFTLMMIFISPAMAIDLTPHAPGYDINVVKMSQILDRDSNITSITLGKSTALVKWNGCEIRWLKDQEFYLIGRQHWGVRLVQKYLLDYHLAWTGENLEKAMKAAEDAHQLCHVVDIQIIQ